MTTKARTPSSFFRLCIVLLCISGMALTCRAMLSGHKVRDYTFEEAMLLLQQGNTDPSRACSALRARIVDAIRVLRDAGPDGTIAIEAIHKETR